MQGPVLRSFMKGESNGFDGNHAAEREGLGLVVVSDPYQFFERFS